MAEKKKKQPFSNIVKNNAYMIKKVFVYSPMLVLLLVFHGIIGGLYSSCNVFFTAMVYEALEKGAEFSEFIPIFIFGASSLIVYWLESRLNFLYFRPWMQNKLHYGMHAEIFNKSLDADLSCFDDPEFYNDFVWAMDESDKRAMQVLESMSSFINTIIFTATAFTVLFMVSPIVVIINFVGSAIQFFLEKALRKINLQSSVERKPYERKESYINRVFHLSEYAKEIRTSRLSEILVDDYDESAEERLKISLKYNKKKVPLSIAENLLWNLPYAATIVVITLGLFNGTVAFAGFMITLNNTWRVRSIFRGVSNLYSAFSNHSLYIDKYVKFMSYNPKIVSGGKKVPDFQSLELRNVSFKYKDSEDSPTILKNVSLSIKKGQKIALVGYNGAGKTTLIKLFMRFYDPTEGEILYNGVNIKEYDIREYRSRIAAVFQDFKLFSATIAENVLGRPAENEKDREDVLKALRHSSFIDKLQDMPNGIDTMVTREFDDEGRDFSGGESQKIAIARVFVKNYDIVVMDEPSSALDPIAEYNLNHSVAEHLKDSTVIFISHRLATTRMTDTIYMLENGTVIEKGSHDSLIALGGKYAEMFNLQAKAYRAKEE